MSGGRFMLDSRFLPLRVWSFTILPLVICPSMLNRGAIYEFLLVWIIHYWVDIKFAYRMCLILEKILIRNWGYYKPCTMGNPGCCEELKGCLLSTTSFWLITMIWLSFLCYAYNTHNWKLLLIPCSQTGLLAKLLIAMYKCLFL